MNTDGENISSQESHSRDYSIYKLIPKPVKRKLAHFRGKLKQVRKKNPTLFDGLSKTIGVGWFVVSTFLGSIASNIYVSFIIISILFVLLYLAQWALLTNKLELHVSESEEKGKQVAYDLMVYAHTSAHEIKMMISEMGRQNISVTRKNMVKFLTSSLNQIEDILSSYYGEPICASIKLCMQGNALKTYARGTNNVKCRGGSRKVKKLNEKIINVNENYAYIAIIDNQAQYFSEGNLKKIGQDTENGKGFFCEYGNDWEKLFNATIIIPIRYPVEDPNEDKYEVLGLVCIDAQKVKPDWNKGTDSYAYRLVAFLADVLCGLIVQYMKEQENQKDKRTKRTLSRKNNNQEA